LEALECIIAAESGFSRKHIDTHPPIALANKISFDATYYEFRFRHPSRENLVTFRLFYISLWEIFTLGKLNWFPSLLQSEVFSHRHHTDDLQALYAFNIGLHQDNEMNYKETLMGVFKFADKVLLALGKNSSANKFLYRETSAQHFNKSAGYYHNSVLAWKNKNPGKKYKCVASASTDNAKSDWRHRAEEAALRAVKDHPKFAFVPFNAISRHYHDMHSFTFKSITPRRKPNIDLDCTHFVPRASVILYRMLWRDLLLH
jgi:hypothetical protein